MEKNEIVCSEEELEKAAGGEGEEEGPMYLEGTVAIQYKQWATKDEVGVRLESGEIIMCELYPTMKKGEIPQGTRVRLRRIGWKYPYMVVKIYE